MQIEISSGEAHFGTVLEGATTSRKLELINRGPNEASVTAQYNFGHLPVAVIPMCIQMGPCGSTTAKASVTLKIQDAAAGPIAGEITFAPSDGGPPAKALVTGLVVASSYELVDSCGPTCLHCIDQVSLSPALSA
jgi:hypothetical protein